MTRVDEYNLLVLGGGLAGKLLRWTLVKEGKRAVVLGRKLISGSCPKEGAIEQCHKSVFNEDKPKI